MVYQAGQDFLQLEEEAFAGLIVVRPHMELNVKLTSYLFHLTSDIIREQGGRGDGDGFVACGEEAPAVATALGYVERFSRLQEIQHGQVVDAASRAARKSKTGQRPTPNPSRLGGECKIGVRLGVLPLHGGVRGGL